ncbi:MAG: hypothetical protein AB8G05_17740 [Oligoflexales bacterium]
MNLLPIDNQLWLTLDTSSWGRIDPGNLSTIENSVKVDSLVLNAHPACDPVAKKCYVEHPCKKEILSDQACVSELVTSSGDMKTKEIARTSLSEKK